MRQHGSRDESLEESLVKYCAKSNTFFLTILQSGYTQYPAHIFKSLLLSTQMQDKLSRGTSYYQQSSANSRSDLKNGQYKWHGKEQMSEMQKLLVSRISEKLDLDEKQAFELADLYFAREPEAFVKLAEFEKLVQDSSQAISQPSTAATQELRKTKQQEYTEKLTTYALSLVTPIIELYYNERLSLIKAQVTLACMSTNPEHPLQAYASGCIDSLFQKDYEDSLWNTYFKYRARWLQSAEQQEAGAAKTKLDWQERERYCEQLVKEEFAMLQYLFVLYYQIRSMRHDTYLRMMDFFDHCQFQGGVARYLKESPEPHTATFSTKVELMIRKVIDISVLLALECLHLDVCRASSSKSRAVFGGHHSAMKEIDSYMQKMPMNVCNVPVQLGWHALYEVMGESMRKEPGLGEQRETKMPSFEGLQFVYEMRSRELLNDGELVPLRSAFLRVLCDWISAICMAFKLRSLPSYDEVVNFCIYLLQDPMNLRAFWNDDFQRRDRLFRVLEEVELQFPYQAVDSLNLLSTLCGDGSGGVEYTNMIVAHINNMVGYTQSLDDPELLGSIEPRKIEAGGREYLQAATKDFTVEGVFVPAGTRAQVLEKKRYGTLIVRWDLVYSAWPSLFAQAEKIVAGEDSDAGAFEKLAAFIRLLCKIITLNPVKAVEIEASRTLPEEDKRESIDITVSSANKILALFGKTLQYFSIQTVEGGLPVIQAILKAICSLYEVDEMKAEVVKFLESPPASTDQSQYMMVQGQLHPLVLLFKAFRERELSAKTTTFSQAALDLAVILVSDQYLQDSFVSDNANLFVSDFLQFIFDEIVRNFDGFPAKSMVENILFMRGVLQLILAVLLKYRSNPAKLPLEFATKRRQPLMRLLMHLMNRVQVSSILLKTLAVKLCYHGKRSQDQPQRYVRLQLQNQLWKDLDVNQRLDSDVELALQKNIAIALAAVSQVLGMVHHQRMILLQGKKETKDERAGLPGYEYFQELGVVGEFYHYFYEHAELPTFFDESSRSIERTPINLVLALVSYIWFERDNALPLDFSQPRPVDNLLVSRSSSFNVSQNAVVCLARLCMIWEQFASPSRPSLLSYLDYSKAEMYSSGQLESPMWTASAELNCQQKLRDELYRILGSYAYNPQLAAVVLELMTISVHSQKSFCDLMMKADKYERDKDFLTVMSKTFAERANERNRDNPKIVRVYGSWVILMHTLMENDGIYEILLNSLREHVMYRGALFELHKTVTEVFAQKNAGPGAGQAVKAFASEALRLSMSKLAEIRESNFHIEELVRDESFSLYVQLAHLDILTREVLRNSSANAEVLSSILDDFFKSAAVNALDRVSRDGLTPAAWQNFSEEFENLRRRPYAATGGKRFDVVARKDESILMSTYSDFNSAVYAWTFTKGRSEGGIVTKWLWNVLDCVNDFGYGKNWCLDTSELWLELRAGLATEVSQQTVWAASKFNLEASLQDVETKYLIHFNQLLNLVVVESEREQLQTPPIAQAISLWGRNQVWAETVGRYVRIVTFLWGSLRSRAREELMNPLEMYKLQHKFGCLSLCFNGLSMAYRDRDYRKSARDQPENEKREENSMKAVDAQLAEVLPEIKELAERNVLGCYHKYGADQLLRSFNSHLASFLQLVLDSQLELSKENEMVVLSLVKPLGEELEIAERLSAAGTQTSFLPLVVSNLEQIVRVVNDEICVNIFGISKSKTIKLLLNRLISENCGSKEFLAIIKFFIAYSSSQKGAQHLYEEKIVQTLCFVPPIFKEISALYEYEEGQRSMTHVVWCWTLFLVRHLLVMSRDATGFFVTALQFLTRYQERLMKTLRFSGYTNPSSNQPLKYSLAYVEELEYTASLLNQFFAQHNKWRHNDYDQYSAYLELFTRYTLKIYGANVALTEAFVPISEPEKACSTLFAKDLLAKEPGSAMSPQSVPKILTSIRSPSKDEYFKPHDFPLKMSRSLSHAYSEESDKYIQGYNPSIFHMRVEISLNKTLLSIVSGLADPLSDEVQDVSSPFAGRMKEYSGSYGSRWAEDLFALMDCILFGLHSYEKCITNYKELSKLIGKMNDLYNTVEASTKYGTLNHLNTTTLNELLTITESHLELSFYVVILYIQGNDIRNKQFSIGFAESKLKERCVNYLRRIMDQRVKKARTVDSATGLERRDESSRADDQGFLKWLIDHFTVDL